MVVQFDFNPKQTGEGLKVSIGQEIDYHSPKNEYGIIKILDFETIDFWI
jgi:hypothetical protein